MRSLTLTVMLFNILLCVLRTEKVKGAFDAANVEEVVHGGQQALAIKNSFIASEMPCVAIELVRSQLEAKCKSLASRADDKILVQSATAVIGTSCFINFQCPSKAIASGALDYMTSNDNLHMLKIEPDLVVYGESGSRANSGSNWGLDRINQKSLPLDGYTNHTYNGKGVNIYILDTGVNSFHNEFAGGRVIHAADYIQENFGEDLNGHGTHCAGIAAGNTYGVATAATIFNVKVLDRSGRGSLWNVIRAVEFSVWRQKKKAGGKAGVISMSLGGPWNYNTNKAVTAAYDAGMIVVVAAGNHNDSACQKSPASAGGRGKVITVMSTNRHDMRSSFSAYGGCADIFAPGERIKSAWHSSATAARDLSGTSMACPFVAGVAASLLHKHAMDRNAARNELFQSAVKDIINDANFYGTPNLFLQTASLYTGPPTVPPSTGAPTFRPTRRPTSFPTKSPIPKNPCRAIVKAHASNKAKLIEACSASIYCIGNLKCKLKKKYRDNFSTWAPSPAPSNSPTTPSPTFTPSPAPSNSPTTRSPTLSPTEMQIDPCARFNFEELPLLKPKQQKKGCKNAWKHGYCKVIKARGKAVACKLEEKFQDKFLKYTVAPTALPTIAPSNQPSSSRAPEPGPPLKQSRCYLAEILPKKARHRKKACLKKGAKKTCAWSVIQGKARCWYRHGVDPSQYGDPRWYIELG